MTQANERALVRSLVTYSKRLEETIEHLVKTNKDLTATVKAQRQEIVQLTAELDGEILPTTQQAEEAFCEDLLGAGQDITELQRMYDLGTADVL